MSDIIQLIEDKIRTGRVVEAGTLLKVHEQSLHKIQLEELRKTIQKKLDQAEKLVKQSGEAEINGQVERALELVRSASMIVVDNPEITAKTAELVDAVELTRSFRKKVERRQVQATSPSMTGRKNKKLVMLVPAVLFIGLFAWYFLRTPPMHHLMQEETRPLPPVVDTNTSAVEPAESTTDRFRVNLTGERKVPGKTELTQPQISIKAIQKEELSTMAVVAPEHTGEHLTPAVPTSPKQLGPREKSLQRDIVVAEEAKVNALLPTIKINTEIPVKSAEAPKPESKTADFPPVKGRQPSVSSETKAAEQVSLDTSEPILDSQTRQEKSTYIVKPGDNLSEIAYRLFCNEPGWGILFKINSDVIEDPNFIVPGTEIRLRTEKARVENLCDRKKKRNEESGVFKLL